ncbi:hypothetical protein Pcinc_018607 [Petrolisthes cinctipes]|uniref:Uncharacterized protein n=1 Tax=Petrolisthes cinctipes TaxID=88211 RepID=A0AAE1FMM5_PETCI|nr:hypothetical protein Pcinc_018607 [Petrolisthes cinctipes]
MVSVKGMVVVVAGMVSVKGMVVVVAGMVSVKGMVVVVVTGMVSVKGMVVVVAANAPHFKTPPSYFSPPDRHKRQPTPNSSSFTSQTLLSLRHPVPPYNLSRREGAPGTQRYL